MTDLRTLAPRLPRAPRRPRRLRVGALCAVVAALPVLAGCGGSASSSTGPQPTLRVGQLGSVELNAALLKASGQDANMPYTVKWQLYPSGGPQLLQAVASLDLGQMADTPMIFAQSGNVPVKVVAAGYEYGATQSLVKIIVPKNSSITSIAQLKGKKVAITQGTILQYTLLQALKKAGVDDSSVHMVNLSPPDAVAAFQSGSVDAMAALDPQLAQLQAQGARVIGDGVGDTSGLEYVVATDKALADPATRKLVLDFTGRLNKAQLWANTHQAQWAADYAKLTGLPLAVTKRIVDRQHFTPIAVGPTVYRWQQQEADAYHRLGLIPQLNVRQEFTTSFNNALVGGAQ